MTQDDSRVTQDDSRVTQVAMGEYSIGIDQYVDFFSKIGIGEINKLVRNHPICSMNLLLCLELDFYSFS